MITVLAFLISSYPIEADKAAHFGLSASINLACVQTIKNATDNKAASIVLCSAATMAIGVGKELSDSYVSHGDLAADALGVSFSALFLSF